jgi:hypothetical protein
MARVRLGFAFEDRARNRLAALADMMEISQNKVLEALLVALPATPETGELIRKGVAQLQMDKGERIAAKSGLLEQIKAMSLEEQRALMIMAQAVKRGTP